MTDFVHALVLGIVQGLTEFIPVSSSAHLVLLPWMLGWPGSGLAFDVALQVGTLVSAVAYFWGELWWIARGSLGALHTRSEENLLAARVLLLLVLGSVPAAIVGLLLQDPIDRVFHAGQRSTFSLVAIAGGLALMGLALFAAERWSTRSRYMEGLRLPHAVLIGAAQALALMPGVSRSGATIGAGLLLGLRRDQAARFSFLMSIPITFGAGLLEGARLARTGLPQNQWGPFLVGIAAAAVVGYVSIRFLLRYLQLHSTWPFALYRVGLAALVLVLVAVR